MSVSVGLVKISSGARVMVDARARARVRVRVRVANRLWLRSGSGLGSCQN